MSAPLKIIKGIGWTIVALALTIVALVTSVYTGWIQKLIVDKGIEAVNRGGDISVAVAEARLLFPLDIRVSGLSVTTHGDTIASADDIRADIRLLPLLKLNVEASTLKADNASYRLGTPDSTVYLRASGVDFDATGVKLALISSGVDIGSARLSRGHINLAIKPDTATTAPDTSQSAPWLIKARLIELTDIDFAMKMEPTIDTLTTRLSKASLANLAVDISRRKVNVGGLSIDGVDARYIASTGGTTASAPAKEADDGVASAPWTITADSLRLSRSKAVYALAGAVPADGFDPGYIAVSQVEIAIDSFYNRGSELRVPLLRLSATERSGIELTASGLVTIDSLMTRASGMTLATRFSTINADAYMGMGDMTRDKDIPVGLTLNGNIGFNDLDMALPSLKPLLDKLPRYNGIDLGIAADGTLGSINVKRLSAALKGHVSASAAGRVDNVTGQGKLRAALKVTGDIADIDFIKPTLLEARTARLVALPPMKLNGTVDIDGDTYAGDLKATTGNGDLALKGRWAGTAAGYEAVLRLNGFPVHSFLPTLGIGPLTASLDLEGRGLDFTAASTRLKADLDIASAVYLGSTYTDLRAWARLADGTAELGLLSFNKSLDLDITATGRIGTGDQRWDISGEIANADLQALGLSADEARGSGTFSGSVAFDPSLTDISADLTVGSLSWQSPGLDIDEDEMVVMLNTGGASTRAEINSGNLAALFTSPMRLDSVAGRLTRATSMIDHIITSRSFDVTALQQALPPMSLTLRAGSDNLLTDILSASDIAFRRLNLNVNNDSLLSASATIHCLLTGDTRLDTVNVNINQVGKYLRYKAVIDNAPGTMDDWAHVELKGYVADEKLAMRLDQRDINGETGFKLGGQLESTDSTLIFKFTPYNPVIGYKRWVVNSDNFLQIDTRHKHLDANIDMSGNGSSLKIFTEHNDTVAGQEDLVVKVDNVHLADWLSLNPMAPPVTGDVSADMRFAWDENSINGHGTVAVDSLVFNRQPVGTFELGVDVSTAAGGVISAQASLMVDGMKTITASGSLNDSTATDPFMLDFSMIRFPLRVLNPFLPPNTVKLSGMVNGSMDITGSLDRPIFNGYINFDTTSVNLLMAGTSFKFSQDRVPVDDNVIKFNGFKVSGVNDSPLTVNGTVDMRSITDPLIDVMMNGKNLQVVGSERHRGTDIYGKAFIDLGASISGNLNFLDIDATIDLLAGTNVTYIMDDAESVISSQSTDGMVKFVNFADSTATERADTIATTGMLMDIDAVINIDAGSTVNVDLSTDGKNRVQLQGQGSLNYTQNYMDDSRLSGRYTLSKGFVRYTPPIPGMSEKRFDFNEGSYVAFNGNMLNPILNISAVDKIKANVNDSGQNSRLVNFNVELSVTNTLQNMNVAFDLSTDDDLTVQNELQSMSPEQRANQAMNILLYGMYSGAGTKSSGQTGGNYLYSFLESQINTWAANNIKGVDLTFGIDQYNLTTDGTTSTATTYSYKISKSLFDDRFKIVVGGNYTADANSDENFAQNLVNDVSFEYLLNRSGTMYVKLFRHVGYESILEGEVTQTGVGFVYKRKIARLSSMFRWFPSRKKNGSTPTPQQGAALSTTPTTAADETKK